MELAGLWPRGHSVATLHAQKNRRGISPRGGSCRGGQSLAETKCWRNQLV